ncbi:threonine synthase [Vagococcus silagei]|uniref:Threonine synthase n=1 Tax=Vagococcus silagei TaxID=2508885 RepID=A0A4V3TVB1_9ENTE|nr:threonine synthase [Vagococcus silagei]THB62249.1 threonine synthase [Vagococcus silagei]
MTNYFQSTRNQNIKVSASQAILQGLSQDGGLFVLPDFTNRSYPIEQLQEASYQKIAQNIFQLFFDEFSREEIAECVSKAYDQKFSHPAITPIVKVGPSYVLELFHGPTSAFKDVALSILPHFMAQALNKQQVEEKILILTATSGDTGKAALEGFRDNEAIDIMVFYPNEGVSTIQERQMQTQRGDNVSVCAIEGNFDDAQSSLKEIFNDQVLQQELHQKQIQLSSANSVNIGRLVPQIVYYFDAYRQLLDQNEIELNEPVDFVVPTGNFGNILAGYYAKKLGLPIRNLICASNDNHILTDFLQTGIYDARREFLKTSSPSMDILISSNLERLLFDVSGQDSVYVNKCMTKLKEDGYFSVDSEILKALQEIFVAGFASDERVGQTIHDVYEETGYVLDPHTAVAHAVMEELDDCTCKRIVLATASPYKFVESVLAALELEHATLSEYEKMALLEKMTGVSIPQRLQSLMDLPVLHQDVIAKDAIKMYIQSQIKGGN